MILLRRSFPSVTTTRVFSRLAQLLARGPALHTTNGHTAVWLQRLQRDDNLWLNAERMEQQGRLSDARRLYLEDAHQQDGRGHHAKAAVARAASAEIVARLGDGFLAKSERRGSAEQFRRHAELAMAWSLREAAWAYEQAATQYAKAGFSKEAEGMRRCATDLHLHLALPIDGLGGPPTGQQDALAQR
jgi:hypothetical protein